MKRIAIFVLGAIFLLSFSAVVFSSDIPAESNISNVTVYPGSVLVSRVATVKIESGEHKVVFSGIVPEIDEGSIRVSASGAPDVKLYGAQVKKEYLTEAPAEKVKELQAAIQAKEDEIKNVENLKSVIADEKSFLDSIKLFSHDQLPKELVTKFPQAAELDSILKFLDAKWKENYAQTFSADTNIRELNKKLEALRNELNQIAGYGRKVRSNVIVELEAARSGSLDLTVSYLVNNASWQPLYDARADFEKSEVELVSYGILTQTTGEDWNDVGISLSTAKPSIGGRMPEIVPWFIRPYRPPVVMERGGRNELFEVSKCKRMQPQSKEKEVLASGSVAGYDADLGDNAKEEYAQAEEKGIAITYTLPRKSTIKSDGTENKLPVSSQNLISKFEYSAYPRRTSSVFLGSKVTNAKDLQLLAGRVNVFFDNDFVGTSGIDNIAPGEEFDLFLGADESVKAKRELVDKKVDQTLIGNIPSPNRRTIYDYKITVENYKSKKIKMNLFDSMPISEDNRINVKIENVSLEPGKKDWKDKKGVWQWEMALNPKEKKEITYTLNIEHPRDMIIEGL
jgi:uncharacterized protein (TIGR02231 family)